MTIYRYAVKNVSKYAGDPNRVLLRSSWEVYYATGIDNSPLVYRWESEPKKLNISYYSPIDKQIHQYWPDFLVQYIDGSIELIEIKPLKQSLAEKANGIPDKLALIQNIAKWAAASRFAKSVGARFRVVSEDTIFRKKSTRQTNQSRPTIKPRGTVKK